LKPVISVLCGFVFAIGLGLSGMTSPTKVLAFLDVTSPNWDPSLMFVMGGAVLAHVFFARAAMTRVKKKMPPLFDKKFFLPEPGGVIDRPLVLGASLFGVGWGLAGYCPGPALVSLAMGTFARFPNPPAVGARNALIFAGVMVITMWITRATLASRRAGRDHRG
jgi:uncharacterized protein